MVGIYKITSPNGRIYIGQSWDVRMRLYKYRYMSKNNKNGQIILENSLVKHGYDNHKFEIVHELPKDITQEVLNNYEEIYLNQYKDLGFKLLNSKEAGSNGKHSQETKYKISLINRGRKRPDMIERNKKMILSEESRNKMRLAKLGNKNRLGGNKYTNILNLS